MKPYEFNEVFEKWFAENVQPTITNPSMIYVTKSIMEKSFLAGYVIGAGEKTKSDQ